MVTGAPDGFGPAGPSRRAVLTGGLGLIGTGFVCSGRAEHRRIVALDWGWAETLIALGRAPVAVVEKPGYRKIVVEPALPEETLDLGVHTEPSLERLYRLRPDAVISTPALESLRHLVEPIAPVISLGIFPAPAGALHRAREQTLALGRAIGASESAETYVRACEQELDRLRARLCSVRQPIFVARIVDARHAVVFGRGSLFQGVLDALGLRSAWEAPTNAYGSLTIGLEKLAGIADAMLVTIANGGRGAVIEPSGPIWQALPFVRGNGIIALPSVWGFGALPSAMRFARLLTAGLARDCGG